MANNFIDVQSQALVIATQMSNETLRPLRPNYIFDGVARSKMWNLNRHPTKGDKLEFPVLGSIAANTAALDPTAVTTTGSVKTVYTRRAVTLKLYGDHATLDTLQMEPEVFADVSGDTVFSLTDQALNSMNLIARDAINKNKFANEASGTLSTTYSFFGSNATSADMGPLKAIDVRKLVAKLKGRNVPTFEDGFYIAIVNENQSTQLRAETGNASWGAAALAGDQSVARRWNGDIGTFEGVRFIVNTEIVVDGATANATFIGRDALGKAIGKELTIAPRKTMQGNHDNLLTIFWHSLIGYRVIRRDSLINLQTVNTTL